MVEPVAHIVIIDDEKSICNIVFEALSSSNYHVRSFNDPKAGIEYIENNRVDLVLTDLVMGEFSGVDVIDVVQANHSDAVVILMTAHPTVEAAIEVLKKGAFDFLVKPFKLELLRATIKRGLEHQRIFRDNVYLKDQVEYLKVSNAAVREVDKEKFMKMVVNYCKREFSAAAVSLMSVDLHSKEVTDVIFETETADYQEQIKDISIVETIIKRKKKSPIINKESLKIKKQTYIKTTISQPICSRKQLMGILNVITINKFDSLTAGQLDILTLLCNSVSSTFTNYQLYNDLDTSYLQAFSALANAIEARDAYTAGHTNRVFQIAEIIATELGWNENQMRFLKIGCTLHDVGKIGVPDSILNKQGKLTDEELKKMNQHPELGLKIIKGIGLFEPAVPYITSHHERYDGTGYPNSLKGEDIPIEGRLLAVADTFDAIMSDRPYRKGRDIKETVEEMLKHTGSQFDPFIVATFLRVLKSGKVDLKKIYGRREDIAKIKDLEVVTEKVPV